MKKNRPGTLLQLLCSQENIGKMKQILFTETTTLGVRYYPISVHRLERRFRTVSIKLGTVTVKEGIYDGQVIQSSPEFEDCKKIAEQHSIPLKKVYEQVWMQLKE